MFTIRVNFKASRGLPLNFCKRKDFVLCRVSTTGSQSPVKAIDQSFNF